MATCPPFDVTIQGDVAQTLDKVKSDVEQNGGTFEGDQNSGTVSGNVPLLGDFQADYTVAGQVATITVTHRPILISCDVIESRMNDYFQNQ